MRVIHEECVSASGFCVGVCLKCCIVTIWNDKNLITIWGWEKVRTDAVSVHHFVLILHAVLTSSVKWHQFRRTCRKHTPLACYLPTGNSERECLLPNSHSPQFGHFSAPYSCVDRQPTSVSAVHSKCVCVYIGSQLLWVQVLTERVCVFGCNLPQNILQYVLLLMWQY